MRSPLVMASLAAFFAISFCCTTASEKYVFIPDYGTGRAAELLAAINLARTAFQMLLSLAVSLAQINSLGINTLSLLVNIAGLTNSLQQTKTAQGMIDWTKAAHQSAPVKFYVVKRKPQRPPAYYTHSFDPGRSERVTYFAHPKDSPDPDSYYKHDSLRRVSNFMRRPFQRA